MTIKNLKKSSILDEIRKIIKFGHIWKNHHFLPKFENIFLQKNRKIINFAQILKNHHFLPKFEKKSSFFAKFEKINFCKNMSGVCRRCVRVCRRCVKKVCVRVCRRWAGSFPCWDLNALVIWSPIQVLMMLNAA